MNLSWHVHVRWKNQLLILQHNQSHFQSFESLPDFFDDLRSRPRLARCLMETILYTLLNAIFFFGNIIVMQVLNIHSMHFYNIA